MVRPREPVCLEQGLKLDLVQLARSGIIRFGSDVESQQKQGLQAGLLKFGSPKYCQL